MEPAYGGGCRLTASPRVSLPEADPNLLDKALRMVAPRTYARRIRDRAIGDMMASGFVGGSSDRRSMKGWSTSVKSADAATDHQLETLRSRSRDMRRNTPYAAGALNQNLTAIVGGGIQVKPEINRRVLGLEDEEAEAWERRVQMIFRAWAESEACDLTRTDDFYGLQGLALRSTMESGDVLVIRRMAGDLEPDEVLGLKIQLVEADRVSNPNHRMDSEKLTNGVETGPDGATRAYHVQNSHPGDAFRTGFGLATDWTRVPAYGAESRERLSFLLFERLRPGQTRGVPYLSPVIEPLKQLDRYTEAELDATVLSAMFTVFIKMEDEWAGENSELGLPDEPTGETDADAGDIKLGKGSIMDLAPGEDVEIADPMRPNQSFGEFTDRIIEQVGVALEIPFEVLKAHYGESYSAARAALQQAWQSYLRRRTWFTRRFCQRVYSWALSEMVARGMVEAPGYFRSPLMRKAWQGTRWTGPSKMVIREDRQVEAAVKRVVHGFSTHEEETAALTGGDFEKNVEELGREWRMKRDRDLPEPGADAGEVTGVDEPSDAQAQLAGAGR